MQIKLSGLDLRFQDNVGQALRPDQLCWGTSGFNPRPLSLDLFKTSGSEGDLHVGWPRNGFFVISRSTKLDKMKSQFSEISRNDFAEILQNKFLLREISSHN